MSIVLKEVKAKNIFKKCCLTRFFRLSKLEGREKRLESEIR